MAAFSQPDPPFPQLFVESTEPEHAPRWPGWSRYSVGWRLFALFLLCLAPRAWMARLVRSVCQDGYYYISVATQCQEGQWSQRFSYLNLNIYPLILMGMNSLGFDWVVGGKVWSVLIASLAVLPLFGWIRRMFSDQVAWAACFCTRCMPSSWSSARNPRDPTFWFLFNLCLYTTLRAITERKLRWFFAGGITLALAVHTRSEGWLLTIPFGIWLAKQFLVQTQARKRLALGGVIWLAVTPLLIVLVNVTVLREEPAWKFGRLGHFAVAYQWLREKIDPPPVQADVAASEDSALANPLPAATPVRRNPTSVTVYFKEMASALEQINLVLLLFGMYCLRRSLWDWDRAALFLMSYALAGAVWILYEHSGVLNGRYFFPIYLALMPYFATGLLAVWNTLWIGAERLEWSWLKPRHTAAFIVLLAIGWGWTDAFTTYHSAREQEADLGEWLGTEYGPFERVVTDITATRAGYHAQKTTPAVLHHWGALECQFEGQPFDLLMLSCTTTPEESRPNVEAAAERLGLIPLELDEDHCARHRFLVFVRSELRPAPLLEPQVVAEQPDKEHAIQ